MREGASDDDLVTLIRATWAERTDRGAEERTGLGERSALYHIERLRREPHKEMHTRGG